MDKVAIFCSSSQSLDGRYTAAAETLVKGLCRKGYGIVSGGSFVGLMGVVSRTVTAEGGFHRGALPEFMDEWAYEGLDETVRTRTMAERKDQMRRGTIAAIALPGGTGTLDELIETQVLIHLGQYGGRLLLLNDQGFYEPFKALLDHYVRENMLTEEGRAIFEFFDTPQALLETL